jgi:hypothetical protein
MPISLLTVRATFHNAFALCILLDLCKSKQGWQNRSDLCRAKEVPGYPTWEINGELYPGEKTLDELEQISGLVPATTTSSSSSSGSAQK